MTDLLKLFEMIVGDSKVRVHWERQSSTVLLGLFSIDDKTVYAIRQVSVEKKTVDLPGDLIFVDFGRIQDGKIDYSLVKHSKSAIPIFNCVVTELLRLVEDNSDSTVVFVSKQLSDSREDYRKRTHFYSVKLQLLSKRNGYQVLEFMNDDEQIFSVSKNSAPLNKSQLVKLCRDLNNDSWIKAIAKVYFKN